MPHLFSSILYLACSALLSLALFGSGGSAQAQTPLDPAVSVRPYATMPAGQQAVRIALNPADEKLYVLARSGMLYRIEETLLGVVLSQVVAAEEHGTPEPIGLAISADGTLYLVGNERVGSDQTRALIRRGMPSGEAWTWETLATTEPYSLSRTWFDHRFNGITLSLDGAHLYVNSGSRTDHGEMYGGIREEGLTAIILRLPSGATDLLLPNDRAALKDAGYVYAEGVRNHFDLAFGPNGHLFGTENAGDRDDSEELNWLREGHHYGFPWRIGTSDTPMQFTPYDPDDDPFVQSDRNTNNQADTGWYFSNDPTYPPPPEGVTFTDPIPNAGPDADHYRDAGTGAVLDASEQGVTVGTFTSHRSPLGLNFDVDSTLAGEFKGAGFVLSWNSGADELLTRIGGVGGDLLRLGMEETEEGYLLGAHRIVGGFSHPIDAELVGDKLYVVEYVSVNDPSRMLRTIYEVTLPADVASDVEADEVPSAAMLTSVFPNPSRDAATVRFALASAAHARVAVYDLLGREVALALEETRPAGAQQVRVDVSGLASGLYLCRLETGGEVHARQLVVVR